MGYDLVQEDIEYTIYADGNESPIAIFDNLEEATKEFEKLVGLSEVANNEK